MKTIDRVASFKSLRHEWQGLSVGFVPTMGALHSGHFSLIARSQKECQKTVVSIFVNPTQFNNAQDLEKYPRPIDQDLELLKAAGVDAVLLPQADEIYADDYSFELREKKSSQVLCGPTRPGHFEGVLTVVMKLFGIVGPRRAYFGEKDFQQLRLIQEMAQAFFLDTEVIGCPTLRESDGLAMSSRNLLLSPADREKAPLIYKLLKSSARPAEIAAALTQAGFKVDYVEEHWGRRFAAAFLGSVRLIDNVELT